MIQDIFPHKLENQYRPEAQPEQDSYVLCYRGAEVLLKDGEMLPTVSEVFAEHYHDRKASGGLVQKYSLLRQLRRRSAPFCGTACHGLRSLP